MTAAEAAARNLAQDYATVFNSAPGQRILADLKAAAQIDKPAFFPNCEPWQPPYRDGARSIVRHIETMSKTVPNTQQTATTNKPAL